MDTLKWCQRRVLVAYIMPGICLFSGWVVGKSQKTLWVAKSTNSYCLLIGIIPTASLCWSEPTQQSTQCGPSAQHRKHTDSEGQHFRAFGVGSWLYLAFPDPPPLGLFRGEDHLHLQLHDQVVVGGALIDVFQGHNVFMLDPEKDKNPVIGTWFRWSRQRLQTQTLNFY